MGVCIRRADRGGATRRRSRRPKVRQGGRRVRFVARLAGLVGVAVGFVAWSNGEAFER